MIVDRTWPTLLTGTTITAAIVVTMPSMTMALTGEEVNEIAREVTVLIKGKEGHGSGVIVAKDNKTYYVLTANHVVSQQDEYKIVTADKQAHALDYGKVKRLSGVDLAVVEFSSDQDYPIAKLANSDNVKQGTPVFISGWPRPDGNAKQLIRQFSDGRVSGFLDEPLEGYKMSYTNVTLGGMSGGPVIDAGGRVVGIHGLGGKEESSRFTGLEATNPGLAASLSDLIKTGFNYAIPINSFLTGAPQAGLYLGLQVENSAPPELGAPYVASSQPDKRDTIDDINNVLNTVDRIRNVGCRLGICF